MISYLLITRLILGESALSLSSGIPHKARKRIVSRAFTQACLSSHVAPMQGLIKDTLTRWCKLGEILAYPECRNLTFTITARLLLGFSFSEKAHRDLLTTFYELESNLFSLPINFPGSGLNKVGFVL